MLISAPVPSKVPKTLVISQVIRALASSVVLMWQLRVAPTVLPDGDWSPERPSHI